MLGEIEGRRKRGWQRMRWLDGITDSMDMSLGEPWCAAVHGVMKSRKQLSDWTELNWTESRQQCKRAQLNYSWVRKFPWRRDILLTPVLSVFPGGSDGKESTCHKETWVWSLGWEDHLEEGIATHPNNLAWRIPMDRGAWQAYSPWGCKELDTTELLSTAQHEAVSKSQPTPLFLQWLFHPNCPNARAVTSTNICPYICVIAQSTTSWNHSNCGISTHQMLSWVHSLLAVELCWHQSGPMS